MNVFSYEFLFHPAALVIEGNKCKYDCFYCFANLTKQSEVDSIQSTINKLKRKNPVVLTDYLLAHGYPICISNKSDPFTKDNYLRLKALTPYLVNIDNGLFIQTKGGAGLYEFVKALQGANKKNVMFYITITNVNDELCKQLEPNAPNSSNRFEIVKMLRREGFEAMIGLNPLCEEWLPKSDIPKYIEKVKTSNASAVGVLPLYFTRNMLNKLGSHPLLTDKVREVSKLDIELLSEQDYAFYVNKTLRDSGIITYSTHQPYYSGLPAIYEKSMIKTFPTQQKFMDYLFTENISREVYFEQYYNFMVDDKDKELWERSFPSLSSMFLIRKNFNLWKGNLDIQRKNTLKDMLRVYWNNHTLWLSLLNNPHMEVFVNDDDSYNLYNGDVVLYFNNIMEDV